MMYLIVKWFENGLNNILSVSVDPLGLKIYFDASPPFIKCSEPSNIHILRYENINWLLDLPPLPVSHPLVHPVPCSLQTQIILPVASSVPLV